MSATGPARTPSNVVRIRGNPGHRPINQREPRPRKKKPRIPEHLKSSPAAVAHYRELARFSYQMNVLREPDGRALAKIARLEADYEEMTRQIEESGFLLQNPETGMVHINPLLKQQREILMHLWRGYREFGFTPAARASLQAGEERKTSDDDEANWSNF